MNWRDHILEHFVPTGAPLTLVADPDGLILDEGILNILKNRGFELLIYTDPLVLRYQYETEYREQLELNQIELIVIVQGNELQLASLPYDLLKEGRKLAFSLAKLFPKLSYPIVSSLDTELDRLYEIYSNYYGPELGEKDTADYILKNVFALDLAVLQTPGQLLEKLIHKHYNMVNIPPVLEEQIVAALKDKKVFSDWPLEKIIPEREYFFRFLEEHWQKFVENFPTDEEGILPFFEVRLYLDNLFLEGYLKPLAIETPQALPGWMHVGVLMDKDHEKQARLEHLMGKMETTLAGCATYQDWQKVALAWAELKSLSFKQRLTVALEKKLLELTASLDQMFTIWLCERYGSLASLPYTTQPVMLHHIPRHLAFRKHELGRIALLVLDGLAQDQWLLIKEYFREKRSWLFEEKNVFAWIPTLTSISRQALFSARPPFYFQESISTTAKERQQWQSFWEDQQVQKPALHLSGLGASWEKDLATIASVDADILGLVINTVDQIMHGMKLGSKGMHQQIKLWLEGEYLLKLFDWLFENQYAVFLTADHGNVEALGAGNIKDGILAETRGNRARIYMQESLLQRAQIDHTIFWPGYGLPQGYHVLLAKGRTAFAQAGEKVVSHGGITIEEVLVPFVRIREE